MHSRKPAGRRPGLRPAFLLAALAAALLWPLGGCGMIRGAAINGMGDTFADGGEQFSSDGNPEIVRLAMPFALKTMEMLLLQVPDHRPLRLAACRGFTQYAFAFVETEAAALAATDPEAANMLRASAIGLHLRARDHGLRLLEKAHEGFERRLRADPPGAVVHLRKEDLEPLYWTATAWAAAIAIGPDRPELVADLPIVTALLGRGLILDEGYAGGGFHAALIPLECLPANPAGSLRAARRHFERATELAHGTRATPYLALALHAALPARDRAEFASLLEAALAVDPNADPSCRLENVVQQRRARLLLTHQEDLFATAPEGSVPTASRR